MYAKADGSAEACSVPSSRRLRIVEISTEYFNPAEPQKGVFITSRTQALAKLADVLVFSPVAMLDYAVPERWWRGAGAIPRRIVREGIPVEYPRWIYPPLGGALNAWCLFARLLLPLRRLHRRQHIDVIAAEFAHPEGIAAALVSAVLSVPFVVTIRGSELYHRHHRLRRFWMGWAFRRAQTVYAVSDELRDFAIGLGASADRVVTVLNGVDSRIFSPRDNARVPVTGVPVGVKTILSVGYLAEIKGHHRIVHALSGLVRSGIDAVLIIAGGNGRSGDYAAEIHAEIDRCGLRERVRFTGQLSQPALAELMCAVDVLCLASSREGCPNVVNEALACGTPVVAADVGAVRRMIPTPEHGIIVPTGDVPALERALTTALSRQWDRKHIAEWGKARSWDLVASEVLNEMEKALSHCT